MNSRRNFLRLTGALAAVSVLNQSFTWQPTDFTKKAIKPARLKKGDKVAITSPAGAVWDEKQIEVFTKILEGFGFEVVLGKITLKEKFGYFSGTDEARAKELNELFADKTIDGIFSMKGGWGCARLLDKLDYKTIESNPKVLIGFSDITTLLNAIYAKTGLVTFHGPVGNSGWNDFTSTAFKKVIMEGAAYEMPILDKTNFVCVNKGIAKGELIGGNLTVLSGIVGSKYLPSFKNKILFLEEAKEEPYSIDRMLTQLKLSGALDEISGFVFGKCSKCDAEEPQKAFTFAEVIEQHIKPLGIPAITGAAFGHTENKLTLPIGIMAELNAEKGLLKLSEGAVA